MATVSEVIVLLQQWPQDLEVIYVDIEDGPTEVRAAERKGKFLVLEDSTQQERAEAAIKYREVRAAAHLADELKRTEEALAESDF